jgi:hypothetical protein
LLLGDDGGHRARHDDPRSRRGASDDPDLDQELLGNDRLADEHGHGHGLVEHEHLEHGHDHVDRRRWRGGQLGHERPDHQLVHRRCLDDPRGNHPRGDHHHDDRRLVRKHARSG